MHIIPCNIHFKRVGVLNLKHDAEAILKFTASNGLVANASKTVFMILNLTKSEAESELPKEIKINDVNVKRSTDTKLLGVNIDDKQNWKEHFTGTNGLINSLNLPCFHSISILIYKSVA